CASARGRGTGSRRDLLAGVEQALGVEDALDLLLKHRASAAQLRGEMRQLEDAHAVLARDGAADRDRPGRELVHGGEGSALLHGVVRREQEARMDVAVAGMAEAARLEAVPRSD